MIELIQVGITNAELIAKINEIISVVNSMENVNDYNQLTNLPTLNGVEISGATTTAGLGIKIAEAEDYDTITNSLATKAEVNTAMEDAVNTANANTTNVANTKLDKDLGNLTETKMLDEKAYMPVHGSDGEVRKASVETLTNNISLKVKTTDSYDSAVAKQKQILTLEGDQNGNNVDYTVRGGYLVGTSELYFNGQRLVRGTDYIENSSSSITMLTQIPIVKDRLVFVAVPLNN